MRKPECDYDVVVAGGGVGAALGAAKAGARVLLIEKYGFLGGVAITSQVLAYCGFFQQAPEPVKAVGGAANLVLDELRKLGLDCEPFSPPTTLNWIILLEPEAVKLALDRVLAANGVEVLLHTRIAAATRTADKIQSVTLAGMDGRTRVSAESFVDATGDANLSLVAGVPCRTGDLDGNPLEHLMFFKGRKHLLKKNSCSPPSIYARADPSPRRVLSGHKAEVGCKLSAGFEVSWIRHAVSQRSRRDLANTGDRLEPLARGILPMPRKKLALILADWLFQTVE